MPLPTTPILDGRASPGSALAQPSPAGQPGRDTTAKTLRPRAPWLRRHWKIFAAVAALLLVVTIVLWQRSVAHRRERTAALRQTQREGMALLSEGRYESLRKAESVFRRLLRRSPSNPTARQARIFVVAALAVEFGEAQDRAADLLEREGEPTTDLGASARCLAALAAGKRERAAREVAAATKRYPRSPWVAYAHAWVERHADAPERALVVLAGVEGGAAKILLLRSRATALLELDRPREAEALLGQLSEAQAKAPWAILLRLRARLATGTPPLALPELDEALALTTDRRGRVSVLQRRVAHGLLGVAYARLGREGDQRIHTEHAVSGPDVRDPGLADLLTAHLLRQGEAKQAEALAVAALRSFPGRRTLVFVQASAALSLGRPKDALTILGAVPPSQRTSSLTLVEANAAMALDRLEEARKLLGPLRRERPDLLPARLAWARLLARDQRFTEALTEIEEVVRREPRNVEALQEAARLELAQGKAANAIMRLEAAVRIRSADPQLRADLVEAHLAARDWKTAESKLKEALVAFPKDPGLLSTQGHSLLLATRLEEAASAYQKALEQDPKRMAPAIGLAEAWLTLSKLPEAEAAVARVEALSPEAGRLWRGWLLLARWDLGREDPEAAAKLLTEVARKDGEPGRLAAMLLIELHAKLGNRKAAQAELKQQIKRHGNRSELLVAYSLALVETDANDDAISTLGRAEKASEGQVVKTTVLARLHARLSQARWQAGDFPAARRSAQKSLALWPTCGHALAMLGILDYEQMQFRSARQQLRSAVEKDPTLALAHHYLGLSELQLGERQAGRKALARSLELRPKGPFADEARRAMLR